MYGNLTRDSWSKPPFPTYEGIICICMEGGSWHCIFEFTLRNHNLPLFNMNEEWSLTEYWSCSKYCNGMDYCPRITNSFNIFALYAAKNNIELILLHEKFLQFDWLRAVVFQLNLKYLHVKLTYFLPVVV